MKIRCLILSLLGISSASFGQSDIELMAFPEVNYADTVVRSEYSGVGDSEEQDGGTDFDMRESRGMIRKSLVHNAKRDVYFNVDMYHASIDNKAAFDESGESLPDNLYNLGVGGLYRQEFENGWTLGSTVRVGSASDETFDSADELYLRSLTLLRVPHTEYTSWVFVARVNTDGDFPIMPGVGYAFPLSRRVIAMVGFPMIAAGGQITDKLGFFLSYFPALNANAQLDYAISERWIVYTGFKAQAQYFSRAGRENEDDRIRTQDSRLYLGASMQVFERWHVDARVGYIFAREIGEGDDYSEIKDNNIRLDNAPFASASLRFQF